MKNKLEIKNGAFYIDGVKTEIISGDIHYFRIHQNDWEKRLDLAVDFGLNTIQTYVPWNLHEPKKNEFNFSGMLDLAAFLDLAAKKGLYVLLRPAPYICSEWDLGGLPARLLKNKDMVLRSRDPEYLKEVDDYYKRLVPEFAPYLATNGGPIIACAIENEYGGFANDAVYIDEVANILKKYGVDVPLYTTDGDFQFMFAFGRHKDDFIGVNYRAAIGTSEHAKNELLKATSPDHPFFVGEFWAGRSMHWGEKFYRRPPHETSEGYREALELGGNVNFYMFSGGTNFGYMGGANFGRAFIPKENTPNRYIPMTTSYDVDALIHEDGTVGEKYFLCRDVLDKHLGKAPREHIAPEHKTQSVTVKLDKSADFFENIDKITTGVYDSVLPKNMEAYDQDYGVIVYTQEITAFTDVPRALEVRGVKDRATVYTDGEYFATYMRDRGAKAAKNIKIAGGVPQIEMKGEKVRLDIIAENLGRINNLSDIYREHKGVNDGVYFATVALMGCKTRTIDLENRESLVYKENSAENFKEMKPVFLKGTFDAKTDADTYVDFENFGHGYIFINGFNLGRFDTAGPMMTLYLPCHLLKEKDNVIEVVDFAPVNHNTEIKLIDNHRLEGDSVELS